MSRRAHTLGVLLAVALSCTILVPLAPAGATGADAPDVTPDTLQWTRCGGGLQCTTLPVPVDYADPGGGNDRPRAHTPARRRPGEPRRFARVNYGGPGDAGTETLRQTADFLPAAVRRYFDVVSFDPRGVGASRPVRCVDDATFEQAWSEDPTPNGPADLPGFYDGTASSVDLVAECVNTNGDYLARLGSRNVARDLDRIRAAVGDDRLTYVGYSYGTLIGALYAQEFPQNVRALVLDSAVDLSSTMTEEQRDNTAGFEQALDEFLDDCAKDRELRLPLGRRPAHRARAAAGPLRAGGADRRR